MTHILVVDNYDSFVYTIVGYLKQLGASVEVVRNDAVPDEGIWTVYDGVLVSPGPGTPAEAGASLDVIRGCARLEIPMLGVCLGHQGLGEAFGATVDHAPELVHGRTSQVLHDGSGVLAGIPSPFKATRYHSLAVVADTIPPELRVTATTGTGTIMGLEHRDLPLFGVQFHPESILTESGHLLFANWLHVTGSCDAVARSRGLAPQIRG